ncbi:MAG: response regulator [Verrucomicrobiota bacterium]
MNPTSSLSPILVADDDLNDLFLLRRRLDKAGVKHPVVTFSNGEELVSFLRASAIKGEGLSGVKPCLIFLDLKMPRRDGFEVLSWARAQHALKNLPIVVLSGSDLQRDLDRARELGATDYLVKPPEVAMLAKLIRDWVPAQ